MLIKPLQKKMAAQAGRVAGSAKQLRLFVGNLKWTVSNSKYLVHCTCVECYLSN